VGGKCRRSKKKLKSGCTNRQHRGVKEINNPKGHAGGWKEKKGPNDEKGGRQRFLSRAGFCSFPWGNERPKKKGGRKETDPKTPPAVPCGGQLKREPLKGRRKPKAGEGWFAASKNEAATQKPERGNRREAVCQTCLWSRGK